MRGDDLLVLPEDIKGAEDEPKDGGRRGRVVVDAEGDDGNVCQQPARPRD